MPIPMTPPSPLTLAGQGAGGKVFYVQPSTGTAMVDDDSVTTLQAAGWKLPGVAAKTPGNYQQPYVLAQAASPVILPSSGTADAAGGITLTTALPYVPAGVVQIYLPAGVVTGGPQGSGAGLYSVVFSSTTVCQIQGTGVVTTAGAYTQTTAAFVTLASIPVPGGAMGKSGVLKPSALFRVNSSANSKGVRTRYGALSAYQVTNVTTAQSQSIAKAIRNRGSESAQVTNALAGTEGVGSTAGATLYGTVDSSVAQFVFLDAQLVAVDTEYVILEAYSVEVAPGA